MHTPILIVGGGPAGLTTSILLSRHGIPSLLVERHPGTSTHPKATGISTRTMEIFRSWGIEGQIRRLALDVRPEGSARRTLASPELERINLGFPDESVARAISPTRPAVLAQDILEPILRDHAQSYSAAELRFATELRGLEQDSRGVRAALVDRRTGRKSIVRARYLVAADGAASTTRRLLGISTHGVPQIGRYLSILIRADLDAVIAKADVGGGASCCAMYSVVGVGGPTPTVVIPTSRDGRWIVATPWAPDAPSPESLNNADVVEIVRRVAGVPDLAVTLLDRHLVEIGAEVAERFRDRNVFLVGDAAHRTAPTGATGMNTAIQGAHNLAWKLAAVLHGHARDALLDTYEVERRPSGERNLLRSRHELEGLSGIAADLGVVYTSSAIVRDDGTPTPEVVEPTGPSYVGERAPHVWVDAGGNPASTTELARDHLTLMIDTGSTSWARAAERIRYRAMMPLVVAAVGNPETIDGSAEDWMARFGIESGGAVLIRPDGHIAWRSRGAVFDMEATLANVLDRVLGFATEQVCDLPEIDAEIRLRSA